jgi:archaellum biogenesis ATPase FlaH
MSSQPNRSINGEPTRLDFKEMHQQAAAAAEAELSGASDADPSRAEALKLSFTELLEAALIAIRAKDVDIEMEVRAEIIGRFKRSDAQITAALFRLLTEQETGKPAGSTVKAEALDLDTIDGLDALLDGFIPANDLGLMYGAKGSGKTLAALAMGFAAIDGAGFLDHSKPAQKGPVLFIASDSGAPPLMAAMQDLGVADHPAIRGDDRSFYVWAHSASQGMSSWCASINGCVELLQFVKAKGIKLVLIDSAKAICAKAGISYLDNDSIAALLTFIKEAICPHTSVMILSHDGTEKGSHSGAKVWAEVPSIVHNIQQIPDAPQERLWRVVKNRMGSLRELRYQVGEDGGLEVCAGVETIQDATAAVIQVLTEATAKGVTSLSRSCLVQEIQQRFRLAPKTTDNTLQRMARSSKPEICRVPSKRGHYKLSPRLAATVSPNNVSPKQEGQGKNLVRESDLVSTRGVGTGYSVGTQIESPASTQSPGVGYSVNLSPELESDPFHTREVEMDLGETGLVELFSPNHREENEQRIRDLGRSTDLSGWSDDEVADLLQSLEQAQRRRSGGLGASAQRAA